MENWYVQLFPSWPVIREGHNKNFYFPLFLRAFSNPMRTNIAHRSTATRFQCKKASHYQVSNFPFFFSHSFGTVIPFCILLSFTRRIRNWIALGFLKNSKLDSPKLRSPLSAFSFHLFRVKKKGVSFLTIMHPRGGRELVNKTTRGSRFDFRDNKVIKRMIDETDSAALTTKGSN